MIKKVDHQRHSIVFIIGMMGSGKSFIGKALAEALNFYFIDLDEEIVNSEGLSIAKIFETKGETYFRKIESEHLLRLLNHKRVVIATGGGTAIYHEGVDIMNKYGMVIWLKASLPTILQRIYNDSSRPIAANSDSITDLISLYQHRKPIYNKAPIKVWNRGDKAEVVQRILKKLSTR